MKKIYFATSNPFKLKYAKKYLDKFFDIQGIKLDIEEPQSLDQEYVAKYKVSKAYEILKAPVFCEDVGMYIQKYNDFPGILTAFIIKGIGLSGLEKLIDEGDPAYYKTTIAYTDGKNNIIAESIMKGKLTKNKSKNFNEYTPIKSMFIPDGYYVPIADLDEEEQTKLPYNFEHYEVFCKKLLAKEDKNTKS